MSWGIVVMETHSMSAHNYYRYQGVKVTAYRIWTGFISFSLTEKTKYDL